MRKAILAASLIVGAVISSTGLASCGSDEPEEDRGEAVKVEAPAGRMYAGEGMVGLASGSVDYYDKNKTADLHFFLQFDNGQTWTFTSPDMPFSVDKAGLKVVDITIKNSSMRVGNKVEVCTGNVPADIVLPENAVVFSAKISGDTNMLFVPSKTVCSGTTAVSSTAGSFTTKETYYLISFLSDKKGEITVRNAKFAQNMPAVGDMVFSGLEVEYTSDGFILKSASLIPTIAGVPYPTFVISDLRMDVDLEELGDADFTFKCSVFGQSYTVLAKDMYCLPVDDSK